MYSNYEILLIRRFIFSKKNDGYISIFSWFSILGIMIGVATIIIVMSVMNGFRDQLTNRLLGINGHLNIYSLKNEIDFLSIKNVNNFNNNLFNYFPIIETQGLLINDNNSKGVIIKSYLSNDLLNKKILRDKIIKGNIYSNNSNEILIGYALANKINVKIGDKVKIAIPKTDNTIFGNIPRFKTLVIKGIFDLGMYEYDSNLIFLSPEISRKLLLLKEGNFTHVEVESIDPSKINEYQTILNDYLININKDLYTITWMQNNNSLLNALKVEKNVMFLILILIILVASTNIISGLIIFVKEKNKDIGILKTFGLSQFHLIKIFISIGFFIGFIGTFFGVLLGIFICFNLQSIQNFIENTFQIDLFSKEIYYLSSLPSRIDYNEVLWVIIVSLLISLFSTIFPAYRSSRIEPIQTIKNE